MTPSRDRYFDHAATTPVDPRVVREMLPYLGEAWGNPSSIHACGRRAKQAVEHARERVAELLGAEDPSEIVFTAGASEANNWVLEQFPTGAVGPFEHPSVAAVARKRGFSTLGNDGFALLPPESPVEMVSVMAVQNEVGARFDLAPLRNWAPVAHSDVTQAVGKVELDLEAVDFASLSAHKFYGPMGVGALYRRGAPALEPLIYGGGQEGGQRAGTLNVPGIVGLGAACALALDERQQDFDHASHLRALLLDELQALDEWRAVEAPSQSPFVLALLFHGTVGETLVLELDRQGFFASAGSACSSGEPHSWASLRALDVDESWGRGALRISFGRANTTDSTRDLAAALRSSVSSLRRLKQHA
ncbi:MAG: cysteine desulfurase [Fimbriimonadaceae bacterium]|nr:cysteine desulfurase [Fimbriimonadaceae bacterium]